MSSEASDRPPVAPRPAHQRGRLVAGRLCAVAALVTGAAWLAWRFAVSVWHGPAWSAWPLVAAEVAGWLGAALLVWALWAAPVTEPPGRPVDDEPSAADVEIVVRAGARGLPWLRATLLATGPIAPVVVVDLAPDEGTERLAAEYGARYVVAPGVDGLVDLHGLRTAAAACRTPWLLLLDAGDVPRPDVLEVSRRWRGGDDVAVVQLPVAAVLRESPDVMDHGRHERAFEHHALGPALGARGVAMFTGSGALVRTAALRSVDPGPTTGAVAAAIVSSVLFQDGWRILAPGGEPMVATHPLVTPGDAEHEHACTASAARMRLIDRDGALGWNNLTARQRLATLAWTVRPLAGVHRTVLVTILAASLLAGSLPGRFELVPVLALWAPWFVLAPVAIALLSDGTLLPGDRTRQACRTMGAAWRGLFDPRGRPEPPDLLVADAFGLRHGVAPTMVVAGISTVLALRGLSDRFTHTLQPIGPRATGALLLVALWTLLLALDALRLLGRREARAVHRVVTSLPCTIDEQPGLIVDLTPFGAGVLTDADAAIGSRVRLAMVVPTASGCTSVEVEAVVRNAHDEPGGGQRLGVGLTVTDPYAAEALAEHCLVQPALRIWPQPPHRPAATAQAPDVAVVLDGERVPRRLGVRLAALLAVAGALASGVPVRTAAAGDGPVVTGRITGDATALAALGGTSVRLICAGDAGRDGQWGTSDDAYGATTVVAVHDDGSWSARVDGHACWAEVLAGPRIHLADDDGSGRTESAAQVVDLRAMTAPDVAVIAGGRSLTANHFAPPAPATPTRATDTRPATASTRATVTTPGRRWFPEPSVDQLAPVSERAPIVLTTGVVAIALMIAAGVLAGSMLPDRRRRLRVLDPASA